MPWGGRVMFEGDVRQRSQPVTEHRLWVRVHQFNCPRAERYGSPRNQTHVPTVLLTAFRVPRGRSLCRMDGFSLDRARSVGIPAKTGRRYRPGNNAATRTILGMAW